MVFQIAVSVFLCPFDLQNPSPSFWKRVSFK